MRDPFLPLTHHTLKLNVKLKLEEINQNCSAQILIPVNLQGLVFSLTLQRKSFPTNTPITTYPLRTP